MFEQSVISEAPKKRSGATLPVSIGLHLLAFGSAMVAAVWQVDFPEKSPNQIAEFQLDRTIEIPKGNPVPPRPKPASTPQPRPQAAPPNVAPTAIPNEIKPVEPLPTPGVFDPEAQPSETPAGADVGVGDGNIGSPDGTGSLEEPTLTVGGDVKAPIIVKRVEPPYPALAVKMKKEGVVVLQAIIDREGNLRDVQVLRSPHPVLGDAALAAVNQWKFKPGTLNGNAVKTMFNLTVTFRLN